MQCSADILVQEGAYADVTVKLGLVKLLTKTFDICEEAYVNHTQFILSCPLVDCDSDQCIGGTPMLRSSALLRRVTTRLCRPPTCPRRSLPVRPPNLH